MAASEIDRLDPDLLTCTLSSGFAVEIQRLKTRQFFRLLKILTHGIGPGILQTSLDFGSDPSEFAQKLIGLVVMSIPDAENEAIFFLASMCRPAGLCPKRAKDQTKQEKEDDQALWDEFNEELNNPELEDLLDLVEAIVRQEAGDIQALGKRVASMLELAKKTGQLEDKSQSRETETVPTELNGSLAPSPESSISSPTSTGGPTSTSTSSRSAGSGSASRRRAVAASQSV